MSLFVAALNSGSNGNCYYIGNDNEAILVDGGISCRETEKRLTRLGLSIKTVKAIFISHEHGDHIHGVSALVKKFKLPVYITPATFRNGNLMMNEDQALSFRAYESIEIGGLTVKAFPKFHDAADPHSFIVSGNGVHIGILTDIGAICDHVISHFKLCHAAFLEANYDEEMLEKGRYPQALKNRIRGGLGHLSNRQALDLFLKHKSPQLSHLFLSHLSKNNNKPEIVRDLFSAATENTEIIIASRERETALYHIHNHAVPHNSKNLVPSKPVQLTLF